MPRESTVNSVSTETNDDIEAKCCNAGNVSSKLCRVTSHMAAESN